MTATQLFEWFLWGAFANDLTGASDEFVLHDFLIQLMGNTLHLTFEGAGSAPDDSAKALAEKYVGLLGKRTGLALHPITIEEFLARTAPPMPSMNWHAQGWYGRDSRESRDRVSRAMREARNELLASVVDTLRRVYDYLQSAAENQREPAYDAYKAIEVVEHAFGGREADAIKALGTVFKNAKRAANAPRHVPRPGQPPHSTDALTLARAVAHAYARYLRRRP